MQQEKDSEQYVQEHCNSFRAGPVPDYGIKLFDNDRETKEQLGELLQHGDAGLAAELRRIGCGDTVIGGLTVDSVDRFVRRMREGRV